MTTNNVDKISFAAASDAARFANDDRTEQPAFRDATRLAFTDPSQAQRIHTTASLTRKRKSSHLRSTKALGYRPPSGSLTAQAQFAAAHHAQEDPESAKRIAAERDEPVGAIPTVALDGISKEEAARLQSAEHRILGHRPPPGSLAAQAQSAADRNAEVQNRINGQGPASIDINTITQKDVNRLMSEEQKRLGHRPPVDSLAFQAQEAVNARSD